VCREAGVQATILIRAAEPGLDYDNIQVLDNEHSQTQCGVYTL